MIDIYVYLFNLIFETGILPEVWLVGNILPILKNKGCKLDPENYRPITLLSCLCKIFTSILNERLTGYVENVDVLNENQAGFRQDYSTVDHIFSLYALFELLNDKHKKIHCVFIDFAKAFDCIHRNSLISKLIKNKVNGKFLRIIQHIYSAVKSRIVHANSVSDIFTSEIGVRQGYN